MAESSKVSASEAAEAILINVLRAMQDAMSNEVANAPQLARFGEQPL